MGDATAGVWPPSSRVARLARAGADVQEIITSIRCGEEASPSDGASAHMVVVRAPGGISGQPASLARALLREAAAELQSTIGLLGDASRKQVTAAVVPQFAAIGSIPAFYRMLNKPLPTKASPYVESALKPVRALHEVASQNSMPETDCRDWVRKSVDEAGVEFATQATHLLDSMRQQAASLARLNRSVSASSEVSDLDKIHVQLCLDVDTFTQVAATFGASSTEPGLTKLATAVESVWPTYLTHKPAS